MRRLRRRSACERGQALIEFAFVIPMLLVMLLGMIDFARLWMQYQVITDTTREAARRAVVADALWTEANIIDGIRSSLAQGGIDASAAVTVASCSYPPGGAAAVTIYTCRWDSGLSNDSIRVGLEVPYDFTLMGPFLGWVSGGSLSQISLKSSFFMRNE
jgi:Flp pilus assembly protein TadG